MTLNWDFGLTFSLLSYDVFEFGIILKVYINSAAVHTRTHGNIHARTHIHFKNRIFYMNFADTIMEYVASIVFSIIFYYDLSNSIEFHKNLWKIYVDINYIDRSCTIMSLSMQNSTNSVERYGPRRWEIERQRGGVIKR